MKLVQLLHSVPSLTRTSTVSARSRNALVGQLRKLGRRYIDLLIVRLNNPVENKVTGARIHEPIRGDRISVRVRS